MNRCIALNNRGQGYTLDKNNISVKSVALTLKAFQESAPSLAEQPLESTPVSYRCLSVSFMLELVLRRNLKGYKVTKNCQIYSHQ